MNLTIRWESALPVQQALMRQGAEASEELKAATDATATYYVISVSGLRMGGRRSRSADPDDSGSEPSNDGDDNDRSTRSQRSDYMRNQLLDAAQLAPKGKSSIYAQDVQIDGGSEVRFLFPRTKPIIAADKEVNFILDIRRIKVEEKFKLNDMQYQGKLAL
jgi:hypothetical protein